MEDCDVDTDGHQLEEASCFWEKVGGSYIIPSAHWFIDVFGQLSAIFVFCSEHSHSVDGWA